MTIELINEKSYWISREGQWTIGKYIESDDGFLCIGSLYTMPRSHISRIWGPIEMDLPEYETDIDDTTHGDNDGIEDKMV
jgi:hypothetical protein